MELLTSIAALFHWLMDSLTASNICLSALVALPAIYYLYWLGTYQYQLLNKLNIPGYKPLPFVGNLYEMSKHGGPMKFLEHCFKRHGKVFSICYGRIPSIVVGDPEILKQILVKEFQNFRNRSTPLLPKAIDNKSSPSVFHARDENWKRIRNILTPTFSGAKMKQMLPKVERVVDTLMSKLDKIADTGETVDIQEWYSLVALDVIMSTSFGYEGDIQNNPDPKLLKEAEKFSGNRPVQHFLLTIPTIFAQAIIALNRPIYFVKLAQEMVKKRRQQSTVGAKDLIDLMLQAHEPTEHGASTLTDIEITSQALTFLVAGYETTSRALAHLTYFLVLYPDVQEKLFQAIEAAFQEHPDDLLYNLIGKIPYMECALNESQRLAIQMQGPGNDLTRYCSQDCDIGGIHFPKGIEVIISLYLLHHDPVAWPDVLKFDPERFQSPSNSSRHPFQYLPFSAGPRNCIGMRLALMEIKVTLAKVIRKYKFVRAPGLRDFDGTIPLKGIFVKVERRK